MENSNPESKLTFVQSAICSMCDSSVEGFRAHVVDSYHMIDEYICRDCLKLLIIDSLLSLPDEDPDVSDVSDTPCNSPEPE